LDQDWITMSTTRRRRGFIVLVVMIVIVMVTLAGLSFVLTLSTENKAVHRQGDQLQLDEALASGMELLKGFCSQSARQRSEAGGTQDNAAVFGNIMMPLAEGAGDAVALNIVSPDGDRPAGEERFGLQNESARLHLAVLAEWERLAPGSGAAALLQLPGMSEATAAAILDWIDADGDLRPGGAEAEYYASQRLPYEPRQPPGVVRRGRGYWASGGLRASGGYRSTADGSAGVRGGPRGRTALGPPADGGQCGVQHDVGRQAPDQPQPPRSQSPARTADRSF
jgi:hypothetical protein